jgi:hypothetical protein
VQNQNPPGRFLKSDPNREGLWIELDDQQMMENTRGELHHADFQGRTANKEKIVSSATYLEGSNGAVERIRRPHHLHDVPSTFSDNRKRYPQIISTAQVDELQKVTEKMTASRPRNPNPERKLGSVEPKQVTLSISDISIDPDDEKEKAETSQAPRKGAPPILAACEAEPKQTSEREGAGRPRKPSPSQTQFSVEPEQVDPSISDNSMDPHDAKREEVPQTQAAYKKEMQESLWWIDFDNDKTMAKTSEELLEVGSQRHATHRGKLKKTRAAECFHPPRKASTERQLEYVEPDQVAPIISWQCYVSTRMQHGDHYQ